MTVLLAAVVGFLAARLLWLLLADALSSPLMTRSNHRGRMVPTGAGVVLALVVLIVEGGRALATSLGIGAASVVGPAAARSAVLLATIGFTLLGLLDDAAGSTEARGFRGHLGALRRGRLTTGGMKLVGGVAVAVLAVAAARPGQGTIGLVADAALVAGFANLTNLLDRAPGRAIKVGVVAFVLLLVATVADPVLAGVAVVVGAAVALLPEDLRERMMLGDAGSNGLGAALGLGVVLATTAPVRLVTLAAVVALNVAGEIVSFTRVIEAIPPLRAADRAGRRP